MQTWLKKRVLISLLTLAVLLVAGWGAYVALAHDDNGCGKNVSVSTAPEDSTTTTGGSTSASSSGNGTVETQSTSTVTGEDSSAVTHSHVGDPVEYARRKAEAANKKNTIPSSNACLSPPKK